MSLAPLRRTWFAAAPVVLLVATASVALAQAAASKGPTKQMTPADLKAWKTIRQSVLSNDGKWFVYVLAPNEGDATVVVRSTGTDAKETKFPIGDVGTGAGTVTVSGDSRWVAYAIAPPSTAGRGGRGAGRGGAGAAPAAATTPPAPTQNKMGLLNLATGEKKEFDKVRRFAFNGDKPAWVAMQGYPETAASGAADAAAGRGGRGGAAPAAAPHRPRAQPPELIWCSTTSRSSDAINVGNVAEFGFDDSGEWLAYAIDARDQIGNGIQLRNMRTDVVRAVDSDRAMYRSLVWSDSGYALAALRGKLDTLTHDTLFSVVSFANVSAAVAEEDRLRSGAAVAISRPG